jgi:hypothetical protein
MFALLFLNKHGNALALRCTNPPLRAVQTACLVIDMEIQPEFVKDRFGMAFSEVVLNEHITEIAENHMAAPKFPKNV